MANRLVAALTLLEGFMCSLSSYFHLYLPSYRQFK